MLAGRWINIVGPDPEAYEEQAANLRVNTEGRVHITDSSGGSSPTLKFNAKSGLVLIDATEDHPGQAIEILAQCHNSGKKQLMYAFFNADPNSRLETLTGPPDIHGIFYTDCTPGLMAKGVLAMFNGDLWFPRRLIARYLSDQPGGNGSSFPVREHDLLTAREMEILHLLTTGAKNTDIASELSLSVHTIKTHIYHIYKKLDVANRTQAVNWATHNL
ncbi:MAG: response regulator transcription factor [Proteobacteria bacterium]|jgi:DNA-binding NarL/FixJ family response regulator|nr:response regulator transcription factor [Pseudomonadota bacterium]